MGRERRRWLTAGCYAANGGAIWFKADRRCLARFCAGRSRSVCGRRRYRCQKARIRRAARRGRPVSSRILSQRPFSARHHIVLTRGNPYRTAPPARLFVGVWAGRAAKKLGTN